MVPRNTTVYEVYFVQQQYYYYYVAVGFPIDGWYSSGGFMCLHWWFAGVSGFQSLLLPPVYYSYVALLKVAVFHRVFHSPTQQQCQYRK